MAIANEEEEALIIQQISDVVGSAVKATIRDNLTATENLKVFPGRLNLDDQIAVANKRFGELVSQDFTLEFVKRVAIVAGAPLDVTDRYRLLGRFEARRVVRDRCQPLVDQVTAQQAVNEIREEIKALQKQL